MITRKRMLYMACFSLAGLTVTARADNDRTASFGLGVQNMPRYSGSDNYRWQLVPLLQARDGAVFVDSQKGLGYDLQSANGLYLEHTLGYTLGRSDHNATWRDGADSLKGMGNIAAALNTAIAMGWQMSEAVSVEGKATLPFTDSLGVNYQASLTIAPLQTPQDILAWQSAALFGDNRYINTFYGVSRQQSERSDFSPYQARGGFYGVQSSLLWQHNISAHWGTLINVDDTWLARTARRSPLVKQPNGLTVTLGMLYIF